MRATRFTLAGAALLAAATATSARAQPADTILVGGKIVYGSGPYARLEEK